MPVMTMRQLSLVASHRPAIMKAAAALVAAGATAMMVNQDEQAGTRRRGAVGSDETQTSVQGLLQAYYQR